MSKLFAHREDATDRVNRLTSRQRQIMEMVIAGQPSKVIPALARVALAAAWNGAGEPFVEPLARVALAAAWNGAEGSFVQRKSSVLASHAQSGRKLDARA